MYKAVRMIAFAQWISIRNLDGVTAIISKAADFLPGSEVGETSKPHMLARHSVTISPVQESFVQKQEQ